jgi:hypothetical protein
VLFATILILATMFMPRGIIFPVIEHLVPKLFGRRQAKS